MGYGVSDSKAEAIPQVRLVEVVKFRGRECWMQSEEEVALHSSSNPVP